MTEKVWMPPPFPDAERRIDPDYCGAILTSMAIQYKLVAVIALWLG